MPTPTMWSALAYIKPNDCGAPAILNRPSWVVFEGYDRFVQIPLGLKPNVTTVVQCATINCNLDGIIAPEIRRRVSCILFLRSILSSRCPLFQIGTSVEKRSRPPHHLRSGHEERRAGILWESLLVAII